MDIRDRILDAAKRVYAQHGFRGATTRLIANEAGVDLSLDDFNDVAAKVPHIADMTPGGKFHMTDLHRVGGVPLVLKLEIEASSSLKLTLGYNFVHVNDPRTNLFTPFTNVAASVAPPPLRATAPGVVEIEQGIVHNAWAQAKVDATLAELLEEREAVEDLLS